MRAPHIVYAGIFASLFAPHLAYAGGVVIWLEPTAPGEKEVAKVEKKAGTATHLTHVDLAFPPEPVIDADTAKYKTLRDAVALARSKWDDFEVEFQIATDLETALAAIDVIRDERDADMIVEARALQGAAVFRGFDPTDFQEGVRAEPFRVQFVGSSFLNRPWLEALAIDPDHKLGQDVADSATFPDLQKMQDEVALLSDGAVDLAGLPTGASLVIDGVPFTGSGTVPLRPGGHYLHVLRNGVVSGRTEITIAPGTTTPIPLLVDAAELDAARTQVIAGNTTGFPDDVKKAIDQIAANYPGPIFVAANDDGKIDILPYARGAALLKQRPVTVVVAADVGPELVVSKLFDDSDGKATTAPAVSAGLSLEVGIYNGVILGGLDGAFTPGQTVTFANGAESKNISTSALPQPWGGVGLYVLRPVGQTPYILLAGTYSWLGPAHMAPGGRVTIGIPLKDDGSWIRITVGGSAGSDVMKAWQADYSGTPMYDGFLRVGLAQRF